MRLRNNALITWFSFRKMCASVFEVIKGSCIRTQHCFHFHELCLELIFETQSCMSLIMERVKCVPELTLYSLLLLLLTVLSANTVYTYVYKCDMGLFMSVTSIDHIEIFYPNSQTVYFCDYSSLHYQLHMKWVYAYLVLCHGHACTCLNLCMCSTGPKGQVSI